MNCSYQKVTRSNWLPVPIACDNGSVVVVGIPPMTPDEYTFFLRQLEQYRPAFEQPQLYSEADDGNDRGADPT